MENINENPNETGNETPYEDPEVLKQRHGCVTAWLVFMIVANSIIALVYLFNESWVRQYSLPEASPGLIILLGALCIANVVFAALLLKWKRWGFWGFLITDILAFIINLSIGLNPIQCAFGLVGIAVLYGILQIKQGDTSTWENLE